MIRISSNITTTNDTTNVTIRVPSWDLQLLAEAGAGGPQTCNDI